MWANLASESALHHFPSDQNVGKIMDPDVNSIFFKAGEHWNFLRKVIELDYGLVPNMHQTIIYTSDVSFHWWMYAFVDFKELMHQTMGDLSKILGKQLSR